MIGTELIINFENNKAYLTPKIFLSFDQIELPYFFKKSNSVASWIIKILDYNSTDKRIFAEILFYSTTNQPFSANQLAYQNMLSQVEKIGFRSIDTFALLQTLKAVRSQTSFSPSHSGTSTVRYELIPKIVKEVVSIPLENIYFKSGYVSFLKRIGNLENPVEFRVHNQHIREEFDAIKNYFGNILKTKKFKFDITANIINREVENTQVISADIDRIDDKLIESVKLEIVKSITTKKFEDDTEKTLLTIEDLFDVLTENKVQANIFFEDEKLFFEDILNVSNTKHYKHLRFLSEKHTFQIMKLRFILKPFSFIFLLQGENKFYLVWETLNTTEATYIWQRKRDFNTLKTDLKKIEDIIKGIKMYGKANYLSQAEENFFRIYHDYSSLDTGFLNWKKEMEEAMQ